MIVYRDASREEPTRAKLRRLDSLAADGDAAAFLIELGELEQGVVDALHPHREGLRPAAVRLRDAARAAGAAFLAARRGRAPGPHLDRAAESLAVLARGPLPRRIRVMPPEGYVHYALRPIGYSDAARAYRAEVGHARASRAVVLGVRSIGTSLSAVVAAELGSTRTLTVRPRGETGARRVAADGAFTARLTRWAARGADVLVVDEGPGATGETLQAVAGWLRTIGVPEERVALFPSHVWGMPLAPEARRRWFYRSWKHTPPQADDRPVRLADRHGLTRPENLSAGRWRSCVPGALGAPACAHHERVKYRARDAGGRRYLIRYAGLGHWGRLAVSRAEALAAIGAGPPVAGSGDGFMLLHWLDGRPVRRDAAATVDFIDSVGRYVCARARRFRTGRAVDPVPIVEMLLANGGEVFGRNAPGLAAAALRLERLPRREAVVPDARLQPHEWLRTADGYRKVDAVDHGAGLRLPGPTDPAWDVAAAAVELSLDSPAAERLAHRYAAAAGEPPAALAAAATAYRPACAAYGLGEASLSAREAPNDRDRRRLEAEAAFYRGALGRELRRSHAAAA